jgi:hypothetical protein
VGQSKPAVCSAGRSWKEHQEDLSIWHEIELPPILGLRESFNRQRPRLAA